MKDFLILLLNLIYKPNIMKKEELQTPSNLFIYESFNRDFGLQSTTVKRYKWQGVVWLLELLEKRKKESPKDISVLEKDGFDFETGV
jgi:hypothetical protein